MSGRRLCPTALVSTGVKSGVNGNSGEYRER